MELDDLQDIDLNEFDNGQSVSFDSGSQLQTIAQAPARRYRPKQYSLPPVDDSPEDKAFYAGLKAKEAKPRSPDFAPVQPQPEIQLPEQPGYDMIRGDRGRITRAKTIAATLDISFSEAYDGEASYTKKMQAAAPDLFKEAGKSFMRGIGGAYINAGRAMELVGAGDAAQTYVGFGRYLKDAYLPTVKPKDFTFDRLVDPEWWATSVTESVPSMLALVPAAIVGGYAAAGVGGAIGLGIFGQTVLGALGGAALSRPVESAFEAAQSYEEALQKGVPDTEARRQAGEVFKGNLALTGLDAAQFALAFTPLRVLGSAAPKALAARIAAGTAKLALIAATEGGEEAYQTAIQQRARGEVVSWNPEMKESAAVGALFGLGLGGAGSAFEVLTDRVQSRMSDNVAQTYQLAEQTAVARGLDPVAAKVEALDAVAATPEGKAHVEKVIGDLKDIAEGKEIAPLTAEEMDKDIQAFGEKDFVLGQQAEIQQAEPVTMDIASDESLDAIIKGDTSIEQMLGIEPEPKEAFFHGTWTPFKGFSKEKGTFYITNDKSFAESFKRDKGDLVEMNLADDAKVFDTTLPEHAQIARDIIANDRAMSYYSVEDFLKKKFRNGLPMFAADNFIDEVKKQGFDAIRLHEREGVTSIGVFNPDAIETKTKPKVNFLVSEETYQSALASLKEKTTGFHAGVDPTALADLVKIGAYHIERGVRNFAEWSKVMIEQAGAAIKPHLQQIWDQITASAMPQRITPAKLTQEIKSEEGFVYHATNEERLQEIADSGKLDIHRPDFGTDQSEWPDGSRQRRAYFSGKANVVWSFAPGDGKPVIVRTKGGAAFKTEAYTNDIFSVEPVKANLLEYLGEDGNWHPVESLKTRSLMANERGAIELRPGAVKADELAKAESVSGATMPAKDVKAQIRKVTGQAQLAKTISEDDALRGAMQKAEQNARIAFREGSKEAQAQAKADLRDILLKAKVKAEIVGFKEGFKVAEQVTRTELTQAFKDEQESLESTRKALAEIINENLPPEMRGKFLEPLIAKLTEKKQNDILDRIAAVKDKLDKQELIDEIATLQKMKGNIGVDYQRRISELIGDINTKNFTDKTTANIQGLLDFAEREGMPSGVSRKTQAIIARLEGKQASEMSIEDLKELRDTAKHLTELGKLKQQLKYKYHERERQKALKELIDGTHNFDFKTSGQDTDTDTLKTGALYIYTETLQGPRVTEMMDGYKRGQNTRMLERLATAELNAQHDIRTTMESAANEMVDAGITDDIDLTDEQTSARIMANLRLQEGAMGAVEAIKKKFGWTEIAPLTETEAKLLPILRKYSSELHGDKIAALFEEMTNVPFPKMENRFLPLKYEGDFNRPPEEVLLQTPHKVTKTDKGFTIERTPNVKKMPRTDIMAIFEEGINAQLWFLHMQPELDNIAQLVKTKEYVEAAGTTASNWWRDHLDITARRGWSATATHNPFTTWLKKTRGKIGTATLGYKLSSIIMQPFAVFDALAYTQGRYGSNAARKVLAEFSKSWVIPQYAKDYIDSDITHALPMRRGGEVAIEETLQKVGRSKGAYSKFIRGGLSMMTKTDVQTAAGVQQGFERVLLDEGVSVAEAKREAAVLMNLTSGSSDVTYRPHILAHGEVARTWLTFQTFMLNRWGIIAHDMITKGLIKGEGRGRMAALIGLGILVAGKIAEDDARQYIYETINRKKLPSRSMLQDILFALPSAIPVVGNLFESVSSRGGSELPIQKVIHNLFNTAKIPFEKTGEQKAKAAIKGIEAGAILFGGVPGTVQGVDLLEAALFPDKKGAADKIKPQKIKAGK